MEKVELKILIDFALAEIRLRSNATLLVPNAWDVIKQLPSSTHDAIYGTNAIQALQIEGYKYLSSIDELL